MASTINVELGLSTWAATTVIIVSLCQCAFYYYQRLNKQCGWEVLYVAAVEPVTYLLSLVFGSNALIELDGTPFNYMRYGGWLATCPVLLILLSNMPLSRKLKRPTDTLTLLILDQLMIVFGVGAIVYGGPAKVVLFLLGLAAGGGIFYIMYDVWARCIQSYPESAHHGVNALFGLFFTSWTCFPLVWLLGPEGFGVIDISSSIILHALLDIISKNVQSFVAWWVRWRLVPKRRHTIASLDIAAEGTTKSKASSRAAARSKAASTAAADALDDDDIKREAEVKRISESARRSRTGAGAPRADDDGRPGSEHARGLDGTAIAGHSAAEVAAQALAGAGNDVDASALMDVIQRAVDTLRKDSRRQRVRVLVVEADPLRQRMLEDAIEKANNEGSTEVQADFLFRPEDFRLVVAKGRAKDYAAVLVNGEMVRDVCQLDKAMARKRGLLVYSAAQAQRGFDGASKPRGGPKFGGGRQESVSIDGSAVEGSEEESEPSSDEDVDHESEDDDEADSGAIRLRRLFGPLYVVGYRLKLPREMRERAAPVADPNGGAAARGMSRTKSMAHMGRREMADLGCRVFLRHPTDPDSLTALFGRLADARGLRQEAEESKAKVCRAVATAAQATARQRAAALLSRRAALEAQAAATLRGVPSGGRDTHRDDDVASVMDVGFGNARVRREDSGLINLSAALFYDNQGEFESEGEEEVQPAGGARSRARRGSMTGGRGRRGSFAGSAPPLPGSGMGLGGTTTPRGQGVVDPAQVDLERGRSAGLDDAPVDVNRDIYPRRDPGSDREGRTASSSKRRNRSHRSKRRSAVDDNDDDSEAGGYASTGRRSHKSGRSGRSGSRRGGGD